MVDMNINKEGTMRENDGRPARKLTNQEKRELAQKVTTAVAEMLGVEYESDLEYHSAGIVVAQWLKKLPGDGWDVRLPQPR